MSNREARKRTRTLRTLFAAIEDAVGTTETDMLDLYGVEVLTTPGGFQFSVSKRDNTGVTGILAWGPEGTLRPTVAPQEDPA